MAKMCMDKTKNALLLVLTCSDMLMANFASILEAPLRPTKHALKNSTKTEIGLEHHK